MPPANCKEILDGDNTKNTSGIYRINPSGIVGQGSFTVFCDMSLQDGGWTVILRRVNDATSFNRKWLPYRNGFGNLNKNFWLGLQKIKEITDYSTSLFELYVGLENFGGQVRYARYSSFSLSDENSKYELSLGAYSAGDAGDALYADHHGMKFSTPDQDNDNSPGNHCAEDHTAGWWYNNCHETHLTGKYYNSGVFTTNDPDGIVWDTWTSTGESLMKVVMAVRPT